MIYVFFCALSIVAGRSVLARDQCFPNPCANNATCTIIGFSDHHCACPTDLPIGGKNCDQLLTAPNPETHQGDCSTYRCENGGDCVHEHHNIHSCQCAKGYWGKFCEQSHPCFSIPQLCNVGRCVVLDSNLFYCHCPSGFNGPLCEQRLSGPITVEKNVCDSNPCKNNGLCRPLVGNKDFQCECSGSFTGKTCELSTICTSDYCGGHGFCESRPMVGRLCHCDTLYTGKYCEQLLPNPCLSNNPCQNGGTCWPANGKAQCSCRENFVGTMCETFVDIGTCDREKPCLNGGFCLPIPRPPGFVCRCRSNFDGDFCEISTPVNCNSHLCYNGGTCSIVDNKPTCTCLSNYQGAQCESLKSVTCSLDCSPGTCVELDSASEPKFLCRCPDNTHRHNSCRL